MTNQELIEKIAREISIDFFAAKKVLDIIEEVGYKSPDKVEELCQLMREVSEMDDDKVAFLAKEYGYVKLADLNK